MIRSNLNKFLNVRRFKKDIVGNHILSRRFLIVKTFLKKKSKRAFFDFYRIGFVPKPLYFKRKTKFCRYFLKRQQFRLFYGFLKIRIIKKIIKRSLKKKNALAFFLWLLESRLDVLLFRLGFTNSIRMSRTFLKYKFIIVNNNTIKKYDYNLKKFDILNFNTIIFFFFKKKIINSIIKNRIVKLRFPRFIEFNLSKLYFIFLEISKNDLFFFYKIRVQTLFSLFLFYKNNWF